jgi:D-3-phosphoglycerate dehydrogenase
MLSGPSTEEEDMPVVLVAQPIAAEGVDILTSEGFEVRRLSRCDHAQLLAAVEEADGLLVRNAPVDREIIEAARRLRVISRHGAGLETIDLDAATDRGVQVTYTPQANHLSVAEHVLAMMLALAKNMLRADKAVRSGHFDFRHEHYGTELAGATLGIIGLGNIGMTIARKASLGLDMKVMAYDPYVETPPSGVEMTEDLDRLLREADFLSLNVALTPQTEGLIGREQLALMKPTAYLINCSRSAVIVEEDVIAALGAGRLAGAGVDVFSEDPPDSDSPWFTMEQTVLTPHMAAHTNAAMSRMAMQAAQGIAEVLKGRRVTWPANQLAAPKQPSNGSVA